MITPKQISQMLAERVQDFCFYLFPDGKITSNEFCIGNVNGDLGRSLRVCLSGSKVGVWSDFSTGEAGDLLDLFAIKRNIDLCEAIKEAKRWLGIVDTGSAKFFAYKPSTFVKPQKTISLSQSSEVFAYLTTKRKLLPETLSAFVIGNDGTTIIFPYQRDGEIIFIKYIKLERDEKGKKISWVEKNCEPCLFGWHLIPDDARSVTLTEGELDCLTLHQYGVSALSVPFGGGKDGKHKWLEYEFERLSRFDEIYLCFDNDLTGKEAVLDLIERLGRYRCRIVTLPHKDANACLQAGVTREEIQTLFALALTLDPEELLQASTFVDKVLNEFYPRDDILLGYHSPWEKLHGKILFRPCELNIWGGVNGHGKSQLLGHVILNLMQQGARVCVASLELKPQKLLMRLTRQAGGLSEPSEEYIRAIHEWYEDKLWIFDLVGTAKADRLLEVFLYARQRYCIDVFVIDSFLKLDIAEEDYRGQKALIEKLCDFKNEHNCQIHLVVHPRKSQDESHIPSKLDCKGTGAISDLADNCFTVWRNKAKEELKRRQDGGVTLSPKDQEILNQPDCYFSCDKNRNGEWEGRAGLWFDRKSFQYLSYENQRPIQFVQYSNRGNLL